MLLCDFIRQDLVSANLQATTKDDAIHELIDLTVTAGAVPTEMREIIVSAVLTRERTMSTGMGHGVAIPHASVPGIKQVIGAIGLSRSGVSFDSVDGESVSLIILLLTPPRTFQTHIRTLSGIARLLNDRSMREALCACKTAQDVLDTVRSGEGLIH